MKNSKRIKMVLLAAVVLAGVLTGCAGKEGESPATESIVTQSPATEAPEVTEAPKVTEAPDTTDLSQ